MGIGRQGIHSEPGRDSCVWSALAAALYGKRRTSRSYARCIVAIQVLEQKNEAQRDLSSTERCEIGRWICSRRTPRDSIPDRPIARSVVTLLCAGSPSCKRSRLARLGWYQRLGGTYPRSSGAVRKSRRRL